MTTAQGWLRLKPRIVVPLHLRLGQPPLMVIVSPMGVVVLFFFHLPHVVCSTFITDFDKYAIEYFVRALLHLQRALREGCPRSHLLHVRPCLHHGPPRNSQASSPTSRLTLPSSRAPRSAPSISPTARLFTSLSPCTPRGALSSSPTSP